MILEFVKDIFICVRRKDDFSVHVIAINSNLHFDVANNEELDKRMSLQRPSEIYVK